MRLPLTSGRDARRPVAASHQEGFVFKPGSQRAQAVAASETVVLVLDKDSPLPESDADVEDLARRLRGHVHQLAVMVSPGRPVLRRAQQLGSVSTPDGYMPSRVYLVMLAEATRELVATVQSHGVDPVEPMGGRRRRKLRINVLRGMVFAVALTCLFLAGSVPRT
ncbi:DUF6415 family natural product biosynthesis protein [Streptomyces leeuwenhoekii]|uniref:DUF6415 family natural product biosynthesis protein n=1 Tax=Streptomyces leeuwenhoekii TaxID=1437453 RepID=UPI0036FAD1DC